MRFIGNKESIAEHIINLLTDKGLTDKGLTFCDAFCGTGSVADAVKNSFNIVLNDNLKWCVTYSKSRLLAGDCDFHRLGFDPFEYLNNSAESVEGFFYRNYSPGGSTRMYFSPENASRIDYFREQIEKWFTDSLISEDEYAFLLSCLLESVSDVSNTAGVYGAFLKKWDSRASKPIIFNRFDFNNTNHHTISAYNDKIENIIQKVECDILYLDPPYTQNQYGTQYHIFETLILNDNPPISKVTGSRPVTPMRSYWSVDYKAHILFDYVIANTKAKYIVFSYNNDGFLSKEFIEASLKRYGKPESFECRTISYKKYRNFKTTGDKEHFEYLFFVEKKPLDEVIFESPLNYIGNKSTMVGQIKKHLPKNVSTFIDAFGGGFNVGINIKAEYLAYNDINCYVQQIIESFRKTDTYHYLQFMRKTIKKYGLEAAYTEGYNQARANYNKTEIEKRDPKLLFTIILYGFQQQIRFNGNHDFNNPVGMRWFNDKVLEKMVSFSRVIKERDSRFSCKDFFDFADNIETDSFVYLDPPYRLTNGSYNDGKRGFEGWTKQHEEKLFETLNAMSRRGIRFMLSYVIEHDGKTNTAVEKWIDEQGYQFVQIEDTPGKSSWSGKKRKEVLIINYDSE
jgi:adenine-specific DNA-methyltransferase